MFSLPDKFIRVHFTLLHSFSITPSLQSAFMPSTCHLPFKNTKPPLILWPDYQKPLDSIYPAFHALTPRLYLGLITFRFWLRSLTTVTPLPSYFYDYVYRSRLGNGFCSLLPCVWPLFIRPHYWISPQRQRTAPGCSSAAAHSPRVTSSAPVQQQYGMFPAAEKVGDSHSNPQNLLDQDQVINFSVSTD